MPEIEYLILANHAEAVNGLIYVSGGGWTEHWRQAPPDGPPAPSNFGIAVSILVPWTETNRPHHLVVKIESEDGGEPILRVDGDLETGRPPGVPRGSDQRSALALNANISFPRSGGYRLMAEVGGSAKSVPFRVHDQPGIGNAQPPKGD